MFYTNYSDTILSIMLGWVKGITDWIWNIVRLGNNSSGGVFLRWFSNNWLLLVLFLLISCSLIDYLVWLARWRRYYLWFGKRMPAASQPRRSRQDDLFEAYSPSIPKNKTVKEKKSANDIEWFDT